MLREASGDGAVADDELAVIQARDLPGRGALGRLEQLDLNRTMLAGGGGSGEAATQARASVADLDRVDALAVAVERHVADAHGAREQLIARTDRDGVRHGVGREHVQRLAGTVQAGP